MIIFYVYHSNSATSLNNSNQHIALSNGYSVSCTNKVSDVSDLWNSFAGTNIFLHSSFLSALEEAPPSRTSFRYCILYKNDHPQGIIYYQVKSINLYLSLRLDTVQPNSLSQRIWHNVKGFLAKRLTANVLVCGNMTLTGSYGYMFSNEVQDNEKDAILNNTSDAVVKLLKSEGLKIRAILAKDFYKTASPSLSGYGYTDFQVQPNMIVPIDKEWTSYADYQSAMKKKYRTREKRARKKANEIEKRNLSLEDLKVLEKEMNALYGCVVEGAGFNLFMLPDDYFYSLKKHLKDNIKITGYFEHDKLVGFYTGITDHNHLDAHFLGYDPTRNRDCQLYLNMLYDLVNDAIDIGADKLIMSRTALEIKSSVGAQAHDMDLLFKVQNPLMNVFAKRGLQYFTPETKWQPRNPF